MGSSDPTGGDGPVTSRAQTVDAYLEERSADGREVMDRLRALAFRELAGFEERMEYGMPYYRRPTGGRVGIASQRPCIARPVGEDAVMAFRSRLPDADPGKRCVRSRHPERIDPRDVRELLSATAAR